MLGSEEQGEEWEKREMEIFLKKGRQGHKISSHKKEGGKRGGENFLVLPLTRVRKGRLGESHKAEEGKRRRERGDGAEERRVSPSHLSSSRHK